MIKYSEFCDALRRKPRVLGVIAFVNGNTNLAGACHKRDCRRFRSEFGCYG